MRIAVISTLAAVLITGCADRITTHGHIVKASDIATLSVGSSTKQEVLKTLGTPSTLATFDDNRWYYMTATVTTKQFDTKVLNSRDIIMIDFDETGTIASITEKTKEDAIYVNPAAKETATQGQKMGVFEQFWGNLGKTLR